MRNASLNDLSVFVEVAQANGFRAAAENLNMGAGSVSETIHRLEKRLGVRLFKRTTRKISMTSTGERLFERTLPALTELESALDDVNEDKDIIAGTLRLSAPRSSASFFLDSLIAEFCAANPAVGIELIYNDQKVDLVTSGFDAAIRSQTLLEKGICAVEIGPILALAVVASPDYLERKGVPKKPTDLTHHDGVCFAFDRADRLASWSFVEGKKDSYQVMPKHQIIVNEMASLLNFTKAGLGLTYVYKKNAEPFIASGQLVSLLDEYIPTMPRYTIAYLTKRHMSARLRAFIELACQHY